MEFDVLLPIVIFFIVTLSIYVYRKFAGKLALLFEDTKISTREAVLMVISMGIMVTILALMPSQAIQIGFLAIYSYMMFSFTYIALKKWYLAVVTPGAFILLYFYYWTLLVFNIFVIFFALIITVYLSNLFSWKTTLLYTILLTAMDIFQVLVTGYMGQYATKVIELKLPVLLMMPTFPTKGLIGLGLGDVFLAGLLSVQTASRLGPKSGILTAATIGVAMFVFEAALYTTMFARFFPATVIVVAGWIFGIMIIGLAQPRQKSQAKETQ